MNHFLSLTIEIYRRDEENMLAIRAQLPRDPALLSISPLGYERYRGLSSLWFILNESEVKRFASQQYPMQFEDGVHRLDVTGDQCLFYDALVYQEGVARKSSGVVEVAFYSATIPLFFRKMLLKVARQIWTEQKRAEAGMNDKYDFWKIPKVELNFSADYLARVIRLYGQGKGRVALEFGDYRGEENAAALAEDRKNPAFEKKFEHLQQIARNSTYGHHQTAKLFMSIDGRNPQTGKAEGYYWTAVSPRGHRIMNGGLIDHARGQEDKQDSWSIHT